jgi:hypothetical protein
MGSAAMIDVISERDIRIDFEAILKFVIGIKLIVITLAMFWKGIYFPLGILILTNSEVQNLFDILYGILDSA